MSWTNYHSHSHYCDGKYPPEAHIRAALSRGFRAFGCSSHSPVPFDTQWSMKADRLQEYVQEVRSLQQKYAGQIEVYLGLEVDFVPGMTGPSDPLIAGAGLDYTVGSIHFVDCFPDGGRPWEIDGPYSLFKEGLQEIFGGDMRKAVERYLALTREMVEQDCPDVVGHLDKIKMQNREDAGFSESEPWYRQTLGATLEAIRQAGVIVEVNTRGLYKKKTREPYPSHWVIQQMQEMGIPLCLNSDSHLPEEVDRGFAETAALLQAAGVRHLWALLEGAWQPFSFDLNGLKHG